MKVALAYDGEIYCAIFTTSLKSNVIWI